jgi:hypothetical protein
MFEPVHTFPFAPRLGFFQQLDFGASHFRRRPLKFSKLFVASKMSVKKVLLSSIFLLPVRIWIIAPSGAASLFPLLMHF